MLVFLANFLREQCKKCKSFSNNWVEHVNYVIQSIIKKFAIVIEFELIYNKVLSIHYIANIIATNLLFLYYLWFTKKQINLKKKKFCCGLTFFNRFATCLGVREKIDD